VRLRDLDTGNILFESENKGAFVNSAKRWYVRFRVEIWSIEDDAPAEPVPVMTHDYDPGHQNTPRHFECTRLITSAQVKQVIKTIPGFGNPMP
jgi:hypothetical protein